MNDKPGQTNPVTLRVSENGPESGGSFYDQIGGHDTFVTLVRRFYEGVRADPLLWPMYPQEDFEGAIERLSLFLIQYWGGPGTYSEKRGHPRLRMRHQPYKVNQEARDHWLAHMRTALDTLELSPLHDSTMWGYLESAAHSLVNTFEA